MDYLKGDSIETYLGTFLPISTMAAAGLGNAFSDVGGIGNLTVWNFLFI